MWIKFLESGCFRRGRFEFLQVNFYHQFEGEVLILFTKKTASFKNLRFDILTKITINLLYRLLNF